MSIQVLGYQPSPRFSTDIRGAEQHAGFPEEKLLLAAVARRELLTAQSFAQDAVLRPFRRCNSVAACDIAL